MASIRRARPGASRDGHDEKTSLVFWRGEESARLARSRGRARSDFDRRTSALSFGFTREICKFAHVSCGSTTEVQREPQNVALWGQSGSRFRATGCLLVAKRRHANTLGARIDGGLDLADEGVGSIHHGRIAAAGNDGSHAAGNCVIACPIYPITLVRSFGRSSSWHRRPLSRGGERNPFSEVKPMSDDIDV